ncbi:hypothetical protein SCHPADRAFT_317528 [Schizopora paradoxa]|uniref:Uncharacterized protein n=1 Tax=Schizopora paradoxa TaxID=27342 RepID=A0A0H2RY67_9AGAM|nr:hypothetical protein SCHPADRAFT_317528 [Schizopora paradoxa]
MCRGMTVSRIRRELDTFLLRIFSLSFHCCEGTFTMRAARTFLPFGSESERRPLSLRLRVSAAPRAVFATMKDQNTPCPACLYPTYRTGRAVLAYNSN